MSEAEAATIAEESGEKEELAPLPSGDTKFGRTPYMQKVAQQKSPFTKRARGLSNPLLPNLELFEKKIAERPDKDVLIDHNILQADSNLAPSLQAAKKQLEQAKTQDALNSFLSHRPARQDLENRNILKTATVSGSLQAKQDELRKAKLHDALEAKIGNRPSVEELTRVNILHSNYDVSPLLQANQAALQKAQILDTLNAHLVNRPSYEQIPERIKEVGIITEEEEEE
eukprot:Colp12_sorted_trinity150504_noHs@14105